MLRGWRDLNAIAPRAATFTAWVGESQSPLLPPSGATGRWPASGSSGPASPSSTGSCSRRCARSAARSPSGSRSSRTSSCSGWTTRSRATRCAATGRATTSGRCRTRRSTRSCSAARPTATASGCPRPRCRPTAARSPTCRTPTARSASATRCSSSSPPRAGPTPPRTSERMAAARRYAASLEPFASGMYVNAMSDEGAAGVARAYPPAKLARLRALKTAYDPDNVFHLNQNIEPAWKRYGAPICRISPRSSRIALCSMARPPASNVVRWHMRHSTRRPDAGTPSNSPSSSRTLSRCRWPHRRRLRGARPRSAHRGGRPTGAGTPLPVPRVPAECRVPPVVDVVVRDEIVEQCDVPIVERLPVAAHRSDHVVRHAGPTLDRRPRSPGARMIAHASWPGRGRSSTTWWRAPPARCRSSSPTRTASSSRRRRWTVRRRTRG